MIFNSFNFLIIYPFIFLFYYVIPARYKKIRNIYLLLVSYSLYISWKPIYALILLGVTLFSYLTATQIEKSKNQKLTMLIGIFATLMPLLFFKYFNFINEQIVDSLSFIGIQIQLKGLNWAIPLGISFYTFQSMGYIWDVYYKKITSEKDFLTYALFISFFPSLLMGPINKASLVIPQIKNLRTYFDYPKAVEGLRMILWGMFMKVVVADRVAIYVDTVLPFYNSYSGITCFVATIFYSIQIYADFAGYSLMAIGVGKSLGFELTENFRRPYFAVSVTDFWHRWHISLSTWLKDYVYIPLGGSRCSKSRNYLNIFYTFLVSGIWHGASWTFIVWGCLHGVFQIVEKFIGQQKCQYGWFGKGIKIIITFFLINFLWIFFRMPTLDDAWGIIHKIIDFNTSEYFFKGDMWKSMCLVCILLFIKDFKDEFFQNQLGLLHNKIKFIRWVTYIFLIFIILYLGVFGSDQFIYANF
ncbi:MAG: MBOAT family protein [Prevotella sp.]|nr:MBOAT family protein [Prevotella sp.]